MADTQTITTTQAPWAAQQPYLQDIFAQAQGLYGTGGPQYYGSSTVAPLSASTQQALGNMEQYSNANPYLMAARPQITGTLNGDYLSPSSNPYLTDTFNQAADAVSRQFREATLPGMNAAFSLAGRTGSGAQQNALDWNAQALGRNLNELATNIYGGNYQNERNRQIQALGLVPGMSDAQFSSIGQGLKAGTLRDAQAQAELTDQVNRFNFNQLRPYQALSQYLSTVGGGYGSSGTQQQPIYSNDTAQNIGLALGGLGLLGSFF